MKILYLTGAVGIGGVESFLLNVSLMPEVESYFFLFQDGPLQKELEKRGAKVFVARQKFRLRNPISWHFLSTEIAGISKRLGVNCIHSSMAYSALVGAFAAKKANLPHLWFQHGPVGGWMDALAGRLKNQGILCNSQFTLDQQRGLYPNSTFHLVPLGTPYAEMPPYRAEGPLKVVMACRSQEWKGPHLFQEALLQMKDSNVSGKLYLAKGDADYERQIRSKGGLEILPSNSSIETVFFEQDVLVNASITPEPFGLTLIEAMMRGIVPIAPRAGGPLEIIEEEKSGLFFEPGNVSDLVSKIRMLQDGKIRKQLSDGARQSALENFSLEKMFQRLKKIYQSAH